MNNSENEPGRYFVFSSVEVALLLNENERKQFLELAARFEARLRWWGHPPTEYIVLEKTQHPFWGEMMERAECPEELSVTYVSDMPTGVAPVEFRSVERCWGMSLDDAMAAYPNYWEGQAARYAEHFKNEGGTPKGAESCVSTAIPSAEGTEGTVLQSHMPTSRAGVEPDQVGHQADGSNADK